MERTVLSLVVSSVLAHFSRFFGKYLQFLRSRPGEELSAAEICKKFGVFRHGRDDYLEAITIFVSLCKANAIESIDWLFGLVPWRENPAFFTEFVRILDCGSDSSPLLGHFLKLSASYIFVDTVSQLLLHVTTALPNSDLLTTVLRLLAQRAYEFSHRRPHLAPFL
jgi:hypothetical protein